MPMQNFFHFVDLVNVLKGCGSHTVCYYFMMNDV